MTIEARKRRANLRFAAAIFCVPVLLLLCIAALAPSYAAQKGWVNVSRGVIVVAVATVLGNVYALAKGYWRTKDVTIPVVVGFFTAVLGSIVPGLLLQTVVRPKELAGAGMVVVMVAGVVLSWRLARAGQRALWEPIDDALIDSELDVVVRARHKRTLRLSVDRFFLTLSGTTYDLVEDLRDVETVTVAKSLNEERRDVTGGGDEITVAPGPAVRIRLTRGEWYLPVDDADGVARLLTRRRDQAVAALPESRDVPDEFGEYEEVVFRARRDRKLTLTVDDDSLVMTTDRPGEGFYVYEDFAKVGSVEVTELRGDERHDVTGADDQVLLTAGEALAIEVEDGRWLFPIDEAAEVATLIKNRIEHYRLADQDFEWTARRDEATTLSLDYESVGLVSYQSGMSLHAEKDFDELESVAVTTIDEDQGVTIDGEELMVAEGEALRLRFTDGTEWLVAVDGAQDVATTITTRAEHHRVTNA